jgi:hypothetical protein
MTGGEDEAGWADDAEAPGRKLPDWLPLAIASLLVAGWSVVFGMGATPALMNARGPAEWSALTMQWSTPVLLIALVYLIVQRSSRREASRFGDAAARYAGSRKRWRCA